MRAPLVPPPPPGPELGAGFQAGFLDERTFRFDFRYFGINEAEAATMAPQQLLALEPAELLWRDAGIDPARLDRTRVGVYIGVWSQEYVGRPESVYYPTGTNPSIFAGRISYHFDLRSPSWVANTACWPAGPWGRRSVCPMCSTSCSRPSKRKRGNGSIT